MAIAKKKRQTITVDREIYESRVHVDVPDGSRSLLDAIACQGFLGHTREAVAKHLITEGLLRMVGKEMLTKMRETNEILTKRRQGHD